MRGGGCSPHPHSHSDTDTDADAAAASYPEKKLVRSQFISISTDRHRVPAASALILRLCRSSLQLLHFTSHVRHSKPGRLRMAAPSPAAAASNAPCSGLLPPRRPLPSLSMRPPVRRSSGRVCAVGDVSAAGNTYLIAGAVAVALVGTAFPVFFSRKDTCPECDGAGFVRKSGATLRANAARKDEKQIVCANCNGLGKLGQIDK